MTHEKPPRSRCVVTVPGGFGDYAQKMGLTMSQRQAVTKAKARAYARADRVNKTVILDELVELTGWHRDYARAALRSSDLLALVGRSYLSCLVNSGMGSQLGPRSGGRLRLTRGAHRHPRLIDSHGISIPPRTHTRGCRSQTGNDMGLT